MVTSEQLIARYPAMTGLSETRFNLFLQDAIGFMGDIEFRWCNFYDSAQAALIAHLVETNGGVDGGAELDAGAGPVVRTDVDDVEVEYAGKVWDSISPNDAWLYSTSYGVTYLQYRRMAFAGPRVV
jgi:hypothetical protein